MHVSILPWLLKQLLDNSCVSYLRDTYAKHDKQTEVEVLDNKLQHDNREKQVLRLFTFSPSSNTLQFANSVLSW